MDKLVTLFICLAIVAELQSCKRNSEAQTNPPANLPRTSPPTILSDSIRLLLQAAKSDGIELHSIMVVQNGHVIYEQWMNEGNPHSPHILNSVSKTFTAIAVGMVIENGQLKLEDKLISFFPEELPDSVSDHLADIEIRDLLTMTCGHATDHTYEMQRIAKNDSSMNWVRQFLSYPVEYTPGEVYCYNSAGTYILSAIVQKVTGKKVLDMLNERLFEPLHIENAHWTETNQGINHGGWGLFLKTEDLAKVGQLLLQNGQWYGKQIISAAWIKEMSKKQVDSSPAGINSIDLQEREIDPSADDWVQGYGYQMWRCRHNAFRADGANGQYIIVLPTQNSVIAITADTKDMQKEINLVWKYILPVLNKLSNLK